MGVAWAERDGPYSGPDRPQAEEDAFRWGVRQLYNNRQYDALEKEMAEVRAGAPVFGNGDWKIYVFYQSLRCRDNEPEGMWQLHETIDEAWERAEPQSVTARVAHADFLTTYAWHARGDGVASKVSAEGARLFQERLAAAQVALDAAKGLKPQCPMWWAVEMRVAQGQGWKRADFVRVMLEARQVAPKFSYYDIAVAKYLAPQWCGKPGEWEKAAEADIQRPGGLGLEGYTRVVCQMRGFYDNIFHDSQASWPKTKAGFEVMQKRYPESLGNLSTYCQVACTAGDRALAQKLFGELNGYVDQLVWGSPSDYEQCRDWAFRAGP